MERIPDFRDWDGLIEHFEHWWLDGGPNSRAALFSAAAQMSAEPLQDGGAYTLDDLTRRLDVCLQAKARLVEQLPAAHDYLHQALALATEAEATAEDGRRRNWSEQKTLAEGRCHGFLRVCEALERLSATLEQRIDALRTIISTERERMRSEYAAQNAPK
jgi:hypothetical protein